MKRRSFIQSSSLAGLGAMIHPLWLPTTNKPDVNLTILHTNDVHSRLDPFPEGSGRYAGLGGVARRATLIQEIRSTSDNVLLVDAGDMLQGTPYFNLYKGEAEFRAMNVMGYDVATIGNHDFDAGIDRLAQNASNAQFELVSANYNFDDTPVAPHIQNYTLREYDGVRVGIFGLGIELESLVPAAWYGNTRYTDPIRVANETAAHLKDKEDCDFILCLSHLGYKYDSTKVSDVVLAQSTKHIDLIIGGHTHTFLDIPDVRRNLNGEPVIIAQVGWAGLQLGRIDLTFKSGKSRPEHVASNSWVNSIGKE